MEDLKKMDGLTEFQLTNAIEKAASLALASDRDRSEILAEQLTKDNVPKHLTKTATQAFNRRISVVTIGKRKDDTKADDFPLADFNKVASIRGCEEGLARAASLKARPFVFEVHKAAMKKAASAPVAPEESLKDITPLQVLEKIQNWMVKQEALFLDQQHSYMQEAQQLERMVKRASEMINRDIKTSKLLATVHGDTYNKLFAGKVPEEALKKHAAYAVVPKSLMSEFIEKTIQQSDVVDTKHELLMLKREALKRASKEAVELEEKLKKLAFDKKAVGPGYTMLKDIAANAVSVPVNALIAGTKGAVGQAEGILGQSVPFLSAEKGYSPADAVSLSLLSKDRYQDKRMRLIDMLANPDFAQYPAAEIEKAVEDTIATNQDMASPRMREYLKAEVGSRLLAGNRTNKADLAATADILKKVTEAEKTSKESAPEATVAKLPEKTTGGANKSIAEVLPQVSRYLDKIDTSKLTVGDLGGDFDKVLDQIRTDRLAEEAEAEERRRAEVEAIANYIKMRNAAIKAHMLTPGNIAASKIKGQKPVTGKEQQRVAQTAEKFIAAHPEILELYSRGVLGGSSQKNKSKKGKGTP